jgi:hypothetical protein
MASTALELDLAFGMEELSGMNSFKCPVILGCFTGVSRPHGYNAPPFLSHVADFFPLISLWGVFRSGHLCLI